MAVLYEERPSKLWFWGGIVFLALFLIIGASEVFTQPAPKSETPVGFEEVQQELQQFSDISRMVGIIFMVVAILIAVTIYVIVFGTSFAVTDNGIEWTVFFRKNTIPFNNIARVEPADTKSEMYIGGNRRYGPPLVNTASGEEFRPDEYSTDPFKQGVAIFLKDGKKMFVTVKNRESLISLLKSKMS